MSRFCRFCNSEAYLDCDCFPLDGVGTLSSGNLCPQGYRKAMAILGQINAKDEVGVRDLEIPARWSGAVLSDAKHVDRDKQPRLAWQAGAFDRFHKWVDECATGTGRGMNLFIQGSESNTGKSHMAAALTNELLAKGVSAAFVDVCRFIQKLDGLKRQRFDDNGPTLEFLLDASTKCGVLVLDDLRGDVVSDTASTQVWNIINGRYADAKPVIITTNLRLEDLERNDLWRRIMSRIMRNCQVINVDKERKKHFGEQERIKFECKEQSQ